MSTIITIKYADNIALTGEVNNTSRTPSEALSVPEKVLFVNINCNTGLIVDYIREAAHLGSTEFDLWEESTSQLKNVSSHKPHVSGLEVFRPNNTYFLITVERDFNGQVINYVPMIGGKQSRALSEIMGKIKRLTKKSSSTKFQEKGGRKRSQGKSKSSDQINI